MTADQRLAEVFDRGRREGLDALSPAERELFCIQDFILQYENGGLSGYFYNRLPDLGSIRTVVTALRRHRLPELAALLGEAAELFRAYSDPDPPSTWGQVLRRYDPGGRLDELDRRIWSLENYGLGKASIADSGQEGRELY
jgi:hypothetical protein